MARAHRRLGHVLFLLVGLVLGFRPPVLQCPWEQPLVAVLMPLVPSGTAGAVPVNASFWVREYGPATSVSIRDEATGRLVQRDRIEITLSSTEGRLVELRPWEPLAPDTLYEISIDQRRIGSVRTASSTAADTTAPRAPFVTRVRSITADDVGSCYAAGVFVDVEPSPDEPIIFLLESSEGVLEIGSALGELFPSFTIPTAQQASVDVDVIAMDLAGNRSAASSVTGEASGSVGWSSGPIAEEGGCRCVTPPAEAR